jgi:hypothetical protein
MADVIMKMTVITDKSGKVISTYRPPENPGEDDPIVQIGGGPDHHVHELDVPDEFRTIEDPEELHRRAGEYLTSGR